MVVTLVVMARVVVAGGLLRGKLLGSIGLGGGVQVLNLGLAEDAARLLVTQCGVYLTNLHVGVAGRRLVDIGLVDNEEDLGTAVSQFSHRDSVGAGALVCGELQHPLRRLHSLPWAGGESHG